MRHPRRALSGCGNAQSEIEDAERNAAGEHTGMDCIRSTSRKWLNLREALVYSCFILNRGPKWNNQCVNL
jgi:hypothetical protein